MHDSIAPVNPIAPSAVVHPTTGRPPYLNREISWLDFNQRVLELAQDPTFPLLERVKFLAIFSSNLDEFFMKRVGGIQRQKDAGVMEISNDGMTVQEQIDAIHTAVRPMLEAQVACWERDVLPALGREGVQLRTYETLNDDERNAMDQFFVKHIFPVLTPLAVDAGHPFPFISNLSKSLSVSLEHPGRTETLFVRIKVPENLPRWVPLPMTKLNFVMLEDVIRGNLHHLFPGMKVVECSMFRITRNADVEMDEDDADDLLELVELELRRRRLASVVRLELPESMSQSMREFIIDGMEVSAEDVYLVRGPLDMDDLFGLYNNVDIPSQKFKPWTPIIPPRLSIEGTDFFSVIRQGDLLVHHPYEDFTASVEKFVAAASSDPKVLAIKMTLYRTSSDTPFVPALIRAAESGKQVAVLVELKARFDEQRNLELAQRLEKAGVHVVYGIVGLKTHAKIAMVVRDEPDGLRTYCHIGTGNYNPKTASLYTDLGLFTCNAPLMQDVINLFHYLTGRSLKRDYEKLLVAPVNMHDRFLQKIRRETQNARAGKPARIAAKMNALQDTKIIGALYEASQAGVKVDLAVRGFCCLMPKVPGMSDNITVVSVLGRFLEHSRIFYFLNDGQEEYYIGSADWMYRNLQARVEAITPIEDPAARERVKDVLETTLADHGHAWELQADGKWKRRTPPTDSGASDTQDVMMSRTLRMAKKAQR